MVNLLRDLALGVNHKIAYPGEHPIIKEQLEKILNSINSFADETDEISIVFLGDSVIVEDINVDLSEFSSVQLFVKKLKRMNVESLTFDTGCTEIDIGGFLDLVANPPKDVSEYEDINTLLIERKADKVYFNTVEFQIRAKGEEGYVGEPGYGLDMVEGEDFDLVHFLETTCNVKEEDPPSVEADKVTYGLVQLYDSMVASSGDKDIVDREKVFEKVMSSINPEVKRYIIQDKMKLKQISSIIKSIIMTFSDEEIVEIFVNRVRLLGVLDAEEVLMHLTPEKLDSILPEIREKLKLMEIEEVDIVGLEGRLKEKVAKAKKGGVKGESSGESTGVRSEDLGGTDSAKSKRSEAGSSSVTSFVSKFSEISGEEYGVDQIDQFFGSVCLLNKKEKNKAGKIGKGLEDFIKEFVRQFGEDNLLHESVKIRKTFEKVPNEIRKEVFLRIMKSKSPVKITMARILLPLMDAEDIMAMVFFLVEEGQRDMLDGFLSSLDKDKLSKVKKYAMENLKEIGISGKDFLSLWEKLTVPPRSAKRVGGVSKRAYGRLKDKLKASIDSTDIKSLLESLYGSLEAESPEVRINALVTLMSLIEQFFKGDKISVIRRVTDALTQHARKERNKDVYIKYVETLSRVGVMSAVAGYDFLVSAVVSFFAGEVNNIEKAKVIIPNLAEIRTKESTNVLLSLLWEKDLREIVVEKVEEFGVESIPYLMELLKESEDKQVRFSLLKIIQGIGPGALETVKKYLGDKRWFVRRNAVLIIGSIGDEKMLDDIYALKDDHEMVQIELIRTLRHILKTKAETYLLPFLDSNYSEVQKYVISVLSPLVTEEGVTALNKRLLLEKFSKEEDSEIKKGICAILADKGNSQSVEALTNIIESKKVFGIHLYPDDLRFNAVQAISEIGGVRAEELLKSLKRDRSKSIRAFIEQKFP